MPSSSQGPPRDGGHPVRPRARGRVLGLWTLLLALLVALASVFDTRLYHWGLDFGVRTESSLREVYRLCQTFGGLHAWLLVALAAAVGGRGRLRPGPGGCSGPTPGQRLWRAWLVLGSVLLAGGSTLVLKALVRRERPRAHAGEYWFRPWFEDEGSRSGFGMPSGEAAVAFAGAFLCARLFPRAWWVWFAVAAGCALQRMAVGAHFLSDVLVGGAVGCAGAALVWSRVARRAGLEVSAQDPVLARPARVVLAPLLLVVLLGALSWAHAWRPARAEDVLGVFSTRESSTLDVYLRLDEDGLYERAELEGAPDPRLETRSGRWSFGGEGLRMDGGAPLEVRVTERLLRIDEERGPLVLRRHGTPAARP